MNNLKKLSLLVLVFICVSIFAQSQVNGLPSFFRTRDNGFQSFSQRPGNSLPSFFRMPGVRTSPFNRMPDNSVPIVKIVRTDTIDGGIVTSVTEYLFSTQHMLIKNENRQNFLIRADYFNKTWVLVSYMHGIKVINSKEKLNIYLENGDIIKLSPKKEVTNEGIGSFYLKRNTIKKLKSYPVVAVGIQDENASMRYMENIEDMYKEYFTKLFNAYDSKRYPTVEVIRLERSSNR